MGRLHLRRRRQGACGRNRFYVDTTRLHGLEAAPVDQSSGAPGGCYGTAVSGVNGLVVGTGKQNTAAIISGCADAGTAAKVARAYTLNGYSDWFLPSKDELALLYSLQSVVGGFASDVYQSSTQIDAHSEFVINFSGSILRQSFKNSLYRVRAIRAF